MIFVYKPYKYVLRRSGKPSVNGRIKRQLYLRNIIWKGNDLFTKDLRICDIVQVTTYDRSENMNILFFLTPKSDVAFIYEDETLRQALEKMEFHKYAAVPIVSRQGRYVGTITEGDMLWGIKNQFNLNLREAEKIPVTAIRRKSDNQPVYADSKMEDLIDKALNQNFVPVLDDQKNFIGIVTRKDIIQYLCKVKEAKTTDRAGAAGRKIQKLG